MKLRIPVIIVAFVLAFAAGWYLIEMSTDGRQEDRALLEQQIRMLREKASLGTEDDPEARIRWEWERLRNPVTDRVPENIRARELEFAGRIPVKEDVMRERMAKGDRLAKATAFNWTKRGPTNVGGRTRAFGIDVSNTNILVAGGVSGGMWRSTDDGVSWVKSTAPGLLHSTTTLAQDTRAGKTGNWYAGTGEYLGNSASGGGASYRGDGIFKSTDNGVTWSILANTATNNPHQFDNFFDYVWRVATDPSNVAEDEVYAASYGAIWRSTDGGANWTAVIGGSSPYSTRTDVAVTSTGIVYATLSSESGSAGVWRSTNGTTWTNITPGLPSQYSRIVIAISPSNENVVYFLLQQNDVTTNGSQVRGHQLWKYTYTISGGTWSNRGGNLPNETGLSGNAAFDTQGGYDMFLAVKPDDENFLVVGGVNLYKSTDAFATGNNWTRIGGYATKDTYAAYTNQHADQHSGGFRPGSSTIFYSGHDGGLSKTTNITAGSVSWTSLNNGYFTTQFYTIAIDPGTSASNVIVGGTQDNGTWWTNSANSSSNWVDLWSGDGAYCGLSVGGTYYYVSSQNGNLWWIQIDGSGNLTTLSNIAPAGGSGYLFINPFAMDPNNDKLMYLAGGSYVWRNTDVSAIPGWPDANYQDARSINWTQFLNSAETGETVTALGVSTSSANVLYIGKSTGNIYKLTNANTALSTATPVDITDYVNFPGGYTSCIAVDPADANKALAVFSNYEVPSLFYTTDGGTSWTDVGGNLEQNPDGSGNGPSCRWAAIVPGSGSTIYFVGTSTGLYSTTTLNGGSTTWAQEGASTIGNVVVDMIVGRASDGFVAVGTHGNGVYSASILTSTETIEQTVPAEFAMDQNYPNPFNPSTRIQYSVPTQSSIRMSVYDIAGKEIAVIASGDRAPGSYEAVWNGRSSSGVPATSGTYFYRLTATGSGGNVLFTKTGKMLLVK